MSDILHTLTYANTNTLYCDRAIIRCTSCSMYNYSLGVNNIRVGMKYNKDCEPFSDETGFHEPIESVGIDFFITTTTTTADRQ